MDKGAIKGILAKYSPPLSPSQMDEIAEAILKAEEEETPRLSKFVAEPSEPEPSPKKKKKSKSSRMTRRRG